MTLSQAVFMGVLLATAFHSNSILAIVVSIVLFRIQYSLLVDMPSYMIPSLARQHGIQAGLIVNIPFWITFALLQAPSVHNFAHQYVNFLFPRH